MNYKNSIPNKLIDEQLYKKESPSLSAFFREKGVVLQENIGEGFSTLYPQEKIAARLNISVDQLRQKLYGKKPLTRDWLIAICAAYTSFFLLKVVHKNKNRHTVNFCRAV